MKFARVPSEGKHQRTLEPRIAYQIWAELPSRAGIDRRLIARGIHDKVSARPEENEHDCHRGAGHVSAYLATTAN